MEMHNFNFSYFCLKILLLAFYAKCNKYHTYEMQKDKNQEVNKQPFLEIWLYCNVNKYIISTSLCYF